MNKLQWILTFAILASFSVFVFYETPFKIANVQAISDDWQELKTATANIENPKPNLYVWTEETYLGTNVETFFGKFLAPSGKVYESKRHYKLYQPSQEEVKHLLGRHEYEVVRINGINVLFDNGKLDYARSKDEVNKLKLKLPDFDSLRKDTQDTKKGFILNPHIS